MEDKEFVKLLLANLLSGGQPKDLAMSIFTQLLQPKPKEAESSAQLLPGQAGVSPSNSFLSGVQNARAYVENKQRTDPIWKIATGQDLKETAQRAKDWATQRMAFKNRSQPKPLTSTQRQAATMDIRERMRQIALQGGQY